MSTPLDLFRAHLDWLAKHNFRTLTLAELDARIDGAEPLADNEIVLTFDDGYASLDWAAAPALRERGFTAAAFLITSRIGEGGYINWNQARRLADDGVVDFQSHTHSHERWPLGPETFDTVTHELTTSRHLLSTNLDRPVEQFAYLAWPYGRTCDDWDEAAYHLGLSTQFVVQRGAVTRPSLHSRLPRLMTDGMPMALFTRWISALQTRAGALAFNRAFGTIRNLRKLGAYT